MKTHRTGGSVTTDRARFAGVRGVNPTARGCLRLVPWMLLIPCLCTPPRETAAAEEGRWAVLVSGISGDNELRKEYLGQLKDMRAVLLGPMKLPEDRIVVLIDDPSAAPDLNPVQATRENLARAARQIASRSTKDDQVFVFIAGHGSADGDSYRLNLVGPDPTGDELAALIHGIPARSHIVVNTTSCSGASIKALAGAGKIIVTATKSGQERNLTHMGRFLVDAFRDNAADVDKNGRVSVLEAFTYASQRVEDHYAAEGSLQTEHPVLDDSGDGKAHSSPSPENGDGLLARTAYLDAGTAGRAGGGMSAEEGSLAAAAQELERQIEALKYAKPGMAEAEYEKQLESLLLKLAEVNLKRKKR